MTITWLGHSCFILESGGFRALLDPFRDVRGLRDVAAEADAVYCSHGHFDHAHTENVRLTGGRENPFAVTGFQTFHDDAKGAKRGENTVRRFTAENLTVVHLGDLGHLLDREQLAAIGPCDALLVPVGGFYTIDAAQAMETAEALAARVIVPMHYREGDMGFDVLTTLEDFVGQYPADMVRRYSGSSLELTPDMPRQVAVLRAEKRAG